MSSLFYYAQYIVLQALHIDTSISICWFGKSNDALYQSDERRNIGPAEYQIKNPHECLSGIEFMRPKAPEEKCQENINQLAYSLLSRYIDGCLLCSGL